MIMCPKVEISCKFHDLHNCTFAFARLSNKIDVTFSMNIIISNF